MKPENFSLTSLADVPANVIRNILHLLISRGYGPEAVCSGLGFSVEDLKDTNIRVSYRQTSLVIRRAIRVLQDPSIGLTCGAKQTITSFGLPGLGMLTCETLGDALTYLISHQHDSGSLVINQQSMHEGLVQNQVKPRFYDPDLEPFLTEEIFSSGLALIRNLIGDSYRPVKVELSYSSPTYAKEYLSLFRCPVEFGKPVSRVLSSPEWFNRKLPSYDSLMSAQLQKQFDILMSPEKERYDLDESISAYVRARLTAIPDLEEVAKAFNTTERPLRRRLASLDLTYQRIIDRVRYETSLTLLQRAGRSMSEVASAVGFSDERNFRRAFKRWSGVQPSEHDKS